MDEEKQREKENDEGKCDGGGGGGGKGKDEAALARRTTFLINVDKVHSGKSRRSHGIIQSPSGHAHTNYKVPTYMEKFYSLYWFSYGQV
ncbi:hypothetical protein M0802_007528 [Mischocyttarus mexicanus]|nr:hypothetical protein M0802_007528 [Mischocyttarus mexicanus]